MGYYLHREGLNLGKHFVPRLLLPSALDAQFGTPYPRSADFDTDGHVIYFCDEAARIARPDTKNKHRPVVGMPVISVKIGDHCYHGLCDMGASASAIPHSLYKEIMHDIAPAEIEDIDVTIKLAN